MKKRINTDLLVIKVDGEVFFVPETAVAPRRWESGSIVPTRCNSL